jgi:putative peptidoglycan lipid II flippase
VADGNRVPWLWTAPAVMVLVIVAKGLAFVREAVVASHLGVSAASDRYYVAFAAPTVLYNLAAVPYSLWLTARLANPESRYQAHQLYRNAFLIVVGVGASAFAALLIWGEPILSIIAAGTLAGAEPAAVVHAARIGALAIPALGIQAIANAKLFAESRFKAAYLWVAIGGVVGLAVVALSTPRYGTVGAVAGFVAAYWFAAVGAAWSASHPALVSPGAVTEGAIGFGWSVAGRAVIMQLFTQGALLLIYGFSSWLPAGELAAALFASKVQVAVYETLIVTAGVLVYPRMARAVQSGDHERVWAIIVAALRWVIPGAALLAIVLLIFRLEIVALVYRRKAFDDYATGLVAAGLLGLAPGLVGLTLLEIAHRALVLRARLLWYGCVLGAALIADFVVCLWLVPRLGVLGVTLGGSVAALVGGLGLLGYVAQRVSGKQLQPVVSLGLRTVVASGVTIAALMAFHAALAGGESVVRQIFIVGAGSLGGAALFAGLLTAFGHSWRLSPLDDRPADVTVL